MSDGKKSRWDGNKKMSIESLFIFVCVMLGIDILAIFLSYMFFIKKLVREFRKK